MFAGKPGVNHNTMFALHKKNFKSYKKNFQQISQTKCAISNSYFFRRFYLSDTATISLVRCLRAMLAVFFFQQLAHTHRSGAVCTPPSGMRSDRQLLQFFKRFIFNDFCWRFFYES
jgi:hypothetical protein